MIRDSGSTARILNLLSVKDRYSKTPEYTEKPLFRSTRLNACFIIKHTMRPRERMQMRLHRLTATKVILPFSTENLRVGGLSVFVEQPDASRMLSETLGKAVTNPDFRQDMQTLDEISRLPSLDPYLLRERFNNLGREVARCYFDVSEADMARMQKHVSDQIKRLVELTFKGQSTNAHGIANKLAELLMSDMTNEALMPLRNAMRLSEKDYSEGMYGWKGFLYYTWQWTQIEDQLAPIAEDLFSMRFSNADSHQMKELDRLRDRVFEGANARAEAVRRDLESYKDAFNGLVERNEPLAFRNFLLNAPEMFINTGEHLAAITHLVSFWSFRFRDGVMMAVDSTEAVEIFTDLEDTLHTDDELNIA